MSKNWTKAQRAAIDCRDKSLLVCAAAGSGKTATLTERIISSLTDNDTPIDIDRMLIVTFTRAAAAELRQRISAALTDALSRDPSNKHLSEQLIKMSSASICTIDSFYLDIVRSNFDKLGISPSFRTADGNELGILAKSLMEDTIDDFYELHGDDFSQIAECFVSMRGGANLSNIFLDLFYKTESLPEGIDFLKLSAERITKDSELDFLEGAIGTLICSQITEKLLYYKSVFDSFCERLPALDSVSSSIYDRQFITTFIELLSSKNYEECYRHVKSFAPIKLPVLTKIGLVGEEVENYKKVRDRFKKDITNNISKKIFGLPPEKINDAVLETAHITDSLYKLIADFELRFNKEKIQKNVMSFSDIRRYAMKLLVNDDGTPTQTALEYRERYSQIYIDEYQDVDKVQDLIFRSIASESSRFMVGDIKQSIYSFRGAEPSVFASYKKTFPDINSSDAENSCEASIFMSNNFRCDNTVIKFANAVCSYVFSECRESMGYTSDDDLIYSKVVENRVCDEVAAELTVIVGESKCEDDDDEETDETIEASNHELEAKYIAAKISELLRSGRKADGTKIMPHDIAVLARTKAMCAYVRHALKTVGIDCSNDTDENYFENPDVLLVLCLLNTIDNPQRDIYLAGLLRSPFFNFSLDELIQIRNSADASHSLYDALCSFEQTNDPLAEKCRSFNNILDEFRDVASSLSVDKLLRYLYSSDLFVASGLVNSEDTNNLLRLYEYAREFESSSFKGLYNFIVYINRLIEENTKLSSGAGMTNEGKVTLMTIHQSKGLEFPVCFVCNTAAPFNIQEPRESLVCNSDFGVAMKISDNSGYARIDTPMREALIENAKEKQTEEEMRILYVALTRARERLFVTAATSSREESLLTKAKMNRAFKCKHTVSSARSYLDWILAAIKPDETHDFCKVSFIKKSLFANGSVIEPHEKEKAVDTERKDYAKKILGERFAFVYPYKEATKLPAKISVSTLLTDKPKADDAVFIFEDTKNEEYSVPSILDFSESQIKSKEPSPTKRGTATHLFLQFCDFDNAKKNGVRNELARLIDKKFIPRESEKLVFLSELEAFFESSLFNQIHSAKRIIREQRFNILLPTEILDNSPEFIQQTEEEFLAVQGVIDLIIEDENGDVYVFDYKTDRLSAEERNNDSLLQKKMSERHKKQLYYYREAISRLFDKAPKSVSVYSTHAAKLIEIPLE